MQEKFGSFNILNWDMSETFPRTAVCAPGGVGEGEQSCGSLGHGQQCPWHGPEERMAGDPGLSASMWALQGLWPCSCRAGFRSMRVGRQSARTLWIWTAYHNVGLGPCTSMGALPSSPSMCHMCLQGQAQSIVELLLLALQLPPHRASGTGG